MRALQASRACLVADRGPRAGPRGRTGSAEWRAPGARGAGGCGGGRGGAACLYPLGWFVGPFPNPCPDQRVGGLAVSGQPGWPCGHVAEEASLLSREHSPLTAEPGISPTSLSVEATSSPACALSPCRGESAALGQIYRVPHGGRS